jgi:hypothetical protein
MYWVSVFIEQLTWPAVALRLSQHVFVNLCTTQLCVASTISNPTSPGAEFPGASVSSLSHTHIRFLFIDGIWDFFFLDGIIILFSTEISQHGVATFVYTYGGVFSESFTKLLASFCHNTDNKTQNFEFYPDLPEKWVFVMAQRKHGKKTNR